MPIILPKCPDKYELNKKKCLCKRVNKTKKKTKTKTKTHTKTTTKTS